MMMIKQSRFWIMYEDELTEMCKECKKFQWKSAETADPPDGQEVLLCMVDDEDEIIYSVGICVSQFTKRIDSSYWEEYDEKEHVYYLHAGWYSKNVEKYSVSYNRIFDKIIGWAPIIPFLCKDK